MRTLYRAAIAITAFALRLAARLNPKLRQAINGRRTLWRTTEEHYETVAASRKKIIIHVASFGELEQATPLIEKLKADDPAIHIHLTFFSPSGYENAIGKYTTPDLITYLPFDTLKNVRCFLDLTKPDQFIFIRYDVWHTLADELSARKIGSILVCATVNEKKFRNPFTRVLYRTTYQNLDRILTIGQSDKLALVRLGIDEKKMSVSGDTRFDQVITRKNEVLTKNENILPMTFADKMVLIAGSTWEADEALLKQLVDNSSIGVRLVSILVPHEVSPGHITSLSEQYGKRAILFSQIHNYNGESVVIVDTIGKLFALYQYADIAYVGGGFGAGVHN
ncbi:MAG TPA: glycosyltransferase N-terminal domain-containing protein, partial [Candidatus Kapabacteria bacterium]|nr:glycosyltransferase N-terminal domain-containing protein [Candidatus Kapabacteria bacterium]